MYDQMSSHDKGNAHTEVSDHKDHREKAVTGDLRYHLLRMMIQLSVLNNHTGIPLLLPLFNRNRDC
jgi:hypothetical protein